MLAQFADLLEAPLLPWPSPVRHLVLSKRVESVDITLAAFGSQLPDALRHSIPARQYEYVLGRLAAGVLLAECGVTPQHCWIRSIQRRPIWPDGIVGSITHSGKLVGVTICPLSKFDLCLGTDIESLDQLSDTIQALDICFSTEEKRLMASIEYGYLIGFSAKEALFKCLNPICNVFFDFLDVSIVKIDTNRKSFELALLIDLEQRLPATTLFLGDYRFFADHVWTGVKWGPIFRGLPLNSAVDFY